MNIRNIVKNRASSISLKSQKAVTGLLQLKVTRSVLHGFQNAAHASVENKLLLFLTLGARHNSGQKNHSRRHEHRLVRRIVTY